MVTIEEIDEIREILNDLEIEVTAKYPDLEEIEKIRKLLFTEISIK